MPIDHGSQSFNYLPKTGPNGNILNPGGVEEARTTASSRMSAMSVEPLEVLAPTETEPAESPIIDITPEAMEIVLGARSSEDNPEAFALHISITGSQGVDFIYDLAFDELAIIPPEDERITIGEMVVAVPQDTIPNLRGSVLDTAKVGGGLVIRNPNRPDPLAGLKLELSGELPEKVQQVLDQSVNPSLAEHGGFATLVGVDEGRVFITMGGGCQGCAMSRMTLTEGIQRTILTALPEVVEVVDATDHTAGENPFF